MRTLWINARFLDRPITGVERVARELIGALAEHDLDRQGLWRAPGGITWELRLVAPTAGTLESPWPNIPLLRAGRFAGHAWEQIDLPRLTRNEWLFSPCNTTALFKRDQILFLHDAQPFAIPQNFTLPFRVWYRVLYTIAGHRAAAVLTNSEFSRSELVRRIGLSADKLHVCLLGSEHTLRVTPDDGVMERCGIAATPFLLAVSSSSPNKNFSAVIRALELLGEDVPQCVIVGHDNARVFSDAQVNHNKVQRLGYVSDAELVALYRRALVLVFPSFYEGFGLPPLEAMAQGCPVIISRTSSLPEVGGDAALYCDPADPATLADAIKRLMADPALRARMSANGKVRAAGFSWRRAAHILLDTLTAQTAQEQRQ